MTTPRWDDIAAFRAVAEESSFTRAAARLYVTQPSLSQRVRRLEQHLGVRLLERTTRRVGPTPEGRILLDWAERVQHSWARTADLVSVRAGTARDGAPTGAAATATDPDGPRELRMGALPLDLSRFADHLQLFLPGAAVRTTVDTDARPLLEMVVRGELDAVLTTTENGVPDGGTPGVHVRTVVHEPVWVLLGAGHRAAGWAEVPLAELRDDLWVISPPSAPTSGWEREVLGAHGVTRMRPTYGAASVHEAVDRDGAVSLVPPLHPADPHRPVLPLVDPVLTRHLYLGWDPASLDRRTACELLRAVRSFYRGSVAEVPRYREWIGRHPERFPGIALHLDE